MRLRCVVGLLALAAMMAGCGGESSPSESASPSTSALASGQDALLARAAEITDLQAQGNWAEIRKHFDENMSQKLSEEMLASGWGQLTATVGAYKSRGEPRVVNENGGLVTIDTPMSFERGEYKSRVVFRSDGMVSGFFVLKPEAP